MFFLLRRLFLAFMIGFIPLSVMQLLSIQLSSVVVLSYYLLLAPMDSNSYNLIYILNEVFIYSSAVVMVLFSEYVIVTDTRWIVGYSYIGVTCACIAVNIFILLIIGLSFIKNTCRLRRLKKKSQEAELKKSAKV